MGSCTPNPKHIPNPNHPTQMNPQTATNEHRNLQSQPQPALPQPPATTPTPTAAPGTELRRKAYIHMQRNWIILRGLYGSGSSGGRAEVVLLSPFPLPPAGGEGRGDQRNQGSVRHQTGDGYMGAGQDSDEAVVIGKQRKSWWTTDKVIQGEGDSGLQESAIDKLYNTFPGVCGKGNLVYTKYIVLQDKGARHGLSSS
ncbi:hypothetical protein EJ05DRAFT_481961 [Pseudovirgaria hyperparasitica]|uniref:Uncharacterized protein n=1 Tax=Pseudovirgaria hyperparasitica TaxID=470096 RepID=A0A6A6WLN5_9PEZI|nr:uncharacterized protein EJ05DRAFT_481961 [Pseudovirgaria hyperparasitica]KAF2763124.1 hypothetical protein EJ05DRAFT_481961 [Pseudovirgaria hyperparasitica]